jgi:hypothetical protein
MCAFEAFSVLFMTKKNFFLADPSQAEDDCLGGISCTPITVNNLGEIKNNKLAAGVFRALLGAQWSFQAPICVTAAR